ncbi:MAG: flagellar hook-basal body complex protein [Ignavibacteria bacterium]|nr:MAG: flagellar hook-basal body complex protein [Ignavibacteria bacterium]
MALLNSLIAGVSGLRNHQSMMDVIGNNISNVNTIGFKGSRVTFSDTFNQYVRSGISPTATSGGTNAFQVGLGMKINSIDRNWNQGTFERTGITTDLALQGPGMFILKNNGETYFSRSGAFTLDANGKLVNPADGSVVQGKMATKDGVIPPGTNLEDIVLDPNLRLPAVATTKISWGGNLDSTASITRSENYVQSGNLSADASDGTVITEANKVYDESGNEYTFTVTYTKQSADTWDMTYDLTDSNGTSIISSSSTHSLVFDSTTGELSTLDGAAPDVIAVQDSTLGINFDFDLSSVSQLSTPTTISSTVDDNREPTIVNGSLTVYDSLGNAHNLTLRFTKTTDNNWNFTATVPESSGALAGNTGTISFNADGSINSISPNPPVFVFTPAGGASAANVEIDFGSGFDGITQTSSDSVVSALTQNGSAAASMTNFSIDQNGYVVGVFSNGQSKKLAQIMLANFSNLNGLNSAGQNKFRVSSNSGEPVIGTPGDATGTSIVAGVLEQSNVDLSEEFTKMIISQRGFQASARVITTSDQLLQEITNLVR